jgi:hypothetical protein
MEVQSTSQSSRRAPCRKHSWHHQLFAQDFRSVPCAVKAAWFIAAFSKPVFEKKGDISSVAGSLTPNPTLPALDRGCAQQVSNAFFINSIYAKVYQGQDRSGS